MEDSIRPLEPREDGLLYADDVTSAQFMAVMDTFTQTDHECPVCRAKQWEIQLDGPDKPVLLKLPSQRSGADYILTFFMACSTCGYMRTHMAEHICRLAVKLK